jgi:Replication initiator protein A
MIDGGKDARQVGRDEMNLAEFPIAVLTETRPKGMSTLQFKGANGTLTVIGSEAYGLPTAIDADVIIGLLQLTKARTDFTERKVGFTRHELLRLLGWPDRGRYYQRLEESLDRWTTVTLKYDNCWWDNKAKHRISARFHILSNVVISERPGRRRVQTERQRGLPLSYFTWDEIFFESCQDGNLKRLDLDTYFSLKSAVSKQTYRFLDKRFYHRPAWTFDLREFAHEHVGLGRNYADNGKLKEKLRPAIEELESIGFLEPMTPAERYIKVGRGDWNIRVVRKLPPPTEPKPEPKPEPTGLERELIDRGVTASKARELVRDYSEDRIKAQIANVDRTRRKIKDKAAYLVSAIRKDFAPPKAVAPPAPPVELVPVARPTKAVADAYWRRLSQEERDRVDAAALAEADPALRAEIEGERRPSMRRLWMSAVRDEYLKRIHDMPVAG